jgi:hypothetical protein
MKNELIDNSLDNIDDMDDYCWYADDVKTKTK